MLNMISQILDEVIIQISKSNTDISEYIKRLLSFQLSEEGEESTLTTRHSFIQMTKLSNVRGRITYISSHAKQEHLYAVYETTERSYWTELA